MNIEIQTRKQCTNMCMCVCTYNYHNAASIKTLAPFESVCACVRALKSLRRASKRMIVFVCVCVIGVYVYQEATGPPRCLPHCRWRQSRASSGA